MTARQRRDDACRHIAGIGRHGGRDRLVERNLALRDSRVLLRRFLQIASLVASVFLMAPVL
jgi:hypothetical protein